METRPYFLAGDVLANAAVGAIVSVACRTLIGDGWPVAVSMPVGMVAGGLLAVPLAMIASLGFGAFEVMLPVMTTGMIAGMVAPMFAASSSVSAARGAAIGLGVLAATYLLNARLRAKGGGWT